MKCRICGKDNLLIEKYIDIKTDVNRYYSKPVHILKIDTDFGYCPRCMFGQIDYQLGEDFYDSYTMFHVGTDVKGIDKGVSTYNEQYYGNIISRLADITDGQRLLDIGCGPGTMMGYAKDYFQHVKGIDPGKEACEAGRSRGLDIVNVYFDDSWTDEGYSAIAATQVLEHLEKPVDVLKTVARTMRRGVHCMLTYRMAAE